MWTYAVAAIENESDREFIQGLYENYYALMYRKAQTIVRAHHEIEDVIESVMLKLIDRIDLLRACKRGSLRSYLLSCIKNEAINQLRKQKKLYTFDDLEEKLKAVPDHAQVDAGLLREAQVEMMVNALKQLPDREREMLRMKYYEKLSDAEIAGIFGIQKGSVRTLIGRARRMAGEILKEVENNA